MTKALLRLDAYAHWDGDELNLATSKKGLLEFVSILRSGNLGVFRLKEKSTYSNILAIEVRLSHSHLHLTVVGQVTVLSGDNASLLLLSDNLEYLRLQWSKGGRQHLHFDPLSNEFLLSPESEAFIVSLAE